MNSDSARVALLTLLAAILACLLVLGGMALAKAADGPGWWSTADVARCCGEADAVYADEWRINPDGTVTATVTAPGPRSPWAPIGRTYTVPVDRIITEPGNPLGRALLFLTPAGHLYCFAPGAGG